MLLDAAELAGAVSLLIALVFALIPPARTWFADLPTEYQAAVQGIVAVVLGIGSTLLLCGGFFGAVPEQCSSGVWAWVKEVLFAVVLSYVGTSVIAVPVNAMRTRRTRATRDMRANAKFVPREGSTT